MSDDAVEFHCRMLHCTGTKESIANIPHQLKLQAEKTSDFLCSQKRLPTLSMRTFKCCRNLKMAVNIEDLYFMGILSIKSRKYSLVELRHKKKTSYLLTKCVLSSMRF